MMGYMSAHGLLHQIYSVLGLLVDDPLDVFVLLEYLRVDPE